MILAKSNGQSLSEHSELVSRIAVIMVKELLLEKNDDLVEAIRIGGLLHDIGKCTAQFQKKINTDNVEEENIEKSLPYRHNETGWAFLSRNLILPNKKMLDTVLDIVYWHHGISNKLCGYKDTDIVFSEKDELTLMEYLKTIVSESNIINKTKSRTAPSYYVNSEDSEEINSERTIARTCIISSDWIASSITDTNISDETIKKIVNDANIRKNNVNIEKHIFYGNDRFKEQEKIVKLIDKTTQVNAPAGFGKTLLGLLFGFSDNKKIIWVCPRNVVAEDVYKTIINELLNFNIDNISVELFISNEVKASNNNFIDKFSSDIIVTNIDNYLSPSVDSGISIGRLHSIIDSTVIFDEFHELIGEAALFSCFINLMIVRHRMTKSKTLLLSASPTNMHTLWDSMNKTTILPSQGKHYPAPHSKKYDLNIVDDIILDNTGNNLVITNSITYSQKYSQKLDTDFLIHSSLEDVDRTYRLNKLYSLYGKNSERVLGKPNLVGTHLIQASLDISFLNVYESFLSPQTTVQRDGRCDRWGDYDETPSINIVNLRNKSEDKMREILYSKDLSYMWFDFISQFNGRKITLDELYEIYNDFETKNYSILVKFINNRHSYSLDSLVKLYPVKFYNKNKNKSDIKTAGGNKLRSMDSEVFFICKYYNSDKYTNPISTAVHTSFTDEFKEVGNIENRLRKTMKEIRNTNDERYDYNDIISNDKITLDHIRKYAKKSNTPYIRFDKIYHPKFGVISEVNLSKINDL